jgi:hypothetical protein
VLASFVGRSATARTDRLDALARGGSYDPIDMARPAFSSGHGGRWSEALYAVADWIVPTGNPAAAVYGLITVGALLAAEGALHDTYLETVGSVLIAMSLYGFAHAYSNLLGRRIAAGARLERMAPVTVIMDGVDVLKGGSLPLLTLLLAWAIGISLATAVTAAIWTAVASLIALEIATGIRARAGALELLLDAAVGAAMGLGILALKAVVA